MSEPVNETVPETTEVPADGATEVAPETAPEDSVDTDEVATADRARGRRERRRR